MIGNEFMRVGDVRALLASSGTSTTTLVVIVIGEALIIGLLIALVLLLRRNLAEAKVVRRDSGEAFVSGTLEVPLTLPDRSAAATAPPPPTSTGNGPPAPPEGPPGSVAAAPAAPPPAVSWDMNKQEEEEILDPENVPIPAYTGPKLAPRSSHPDVDFDLGIEDDFGTPEPLPEEVGADNGQTASRWTLRRSRRAGQAPPPPFT